MKKLCTFFCMVVVVLSTISTSALATEPNEKVIDLGDGFYVVETITQYPMMRSGNIVSGNTSDSVYYGSTLIGTATLYADFDISALQVLGIMEERISVELPVAPATPPLAQRTSSIMAYRKPSTFPFPAPPTAHSIKIPPRKQRPLSPSPGRGAAASPGAPLLQGLAAAPALNPTAPFRTRKTLWKPRMPQAFSLRHLHVVFVWWTRRGSNPRPLRCEQI